MSDNPLVLRQRVYTLADQHWFAELSGDFNPIHVDSVQARREFFGDIVVHGLHEVLSALDAYAAQLRSRGVSAIFINLLHVKFSGCLYLEHRAEFQLERESDDLVLLKVLDGEQVLAEIKLSLNSSHQPDRHTPSTQWETPPQKPSPPVEQTWSEIITRHGSIPLGLSSSLAASLFPDLTAILSTEVLAELLALTRLVGMECPGRHSLYSSFVIERHKPVEQASPPCLMYQTIFSDSRFSLIRLQVKGPSLAGIVEAFVRPSPVPQVAFSDVEKQISPDEFRCQTALVVGGSRGLGEVTAKIIAAGGGFPIITYHQGAEDAARVVAEIAASGKRCVAFHCDSSQPEVLFAELDQRNLIPTHVYYFASPKIFVKKGVLYSPSLFQQFAAAYVEGVFKLYRACRARQAGRLRLFYPSTTAIDDPVKDLAEYAAAKAAGETLCHYLVNQDRQLSVLIKRLPRLMTDQTVTLVPFPASPPFDILLDLIRAMNGTVA